MFYPTGPQSPAFGVILNVEGFRSQQPLKGGGTELAAVEKSVGERGGRLATFGESARPFGGYSCMCVYMFAVWEPAVFKGLSLEGREEYEKVKVLPPPPTPSSLMRCLSGQDLKGMSHPWVVSNRLTPPKSNTAESVHRSHIRIACLLSRGIAVFLCNACLPRS